MAACKIDWNNGLVEALIGNVRDNEVVWNTSSPQYKNKNTQEAAWVKISNEIGLEGRPLVAKNKLRDLKDTYRKKLKVPKSGDAGGPRKID